MILKEIQVRSAKPKAKLYRLFDGGGLYLEVPPSGGRYWRYKYRFAGKERRLALGVYPDVGLAEARERHTLARKTLADGNDPGAVKREAKRQAVLNSENTFKTIAKEWFETRKHRWSAKYGKSIMDRLEQNLFSRVGNRPIAEIDAPEFLSALRVVEKNGALDLAMRLLQYSGQIFRYAIATGRAKYNPLNDLRGALKAPVRKHQAYLKENELPAYLKKLEAYDNPQTKLALKFLLLTFVRTTELRGAKWTEINFEKNEWRIPVERMKMKALHIVPLSRQAVAVLKEMKAFSGQWEFVFPNQHKPSGCMSENTMLFALYRMGYHSKATGHGFRATASTILNENGFNHDWIERQLAHAERDEVRAAYNYAQYLPERRKMMQWWANYLDGVAPKK